MMDFYAVQWAVVVIALVLLAGGLYWLVGIIPSARLMRCPETGSVVFVDVDAVSGGDDKEPQCAVRHCELWPGRAQCKRGCLARYWETRPGFRVNLEALRPFEPQ